MAEPKYYGNQLHEEIGDKSDPNFFEDCWFKCNEKREGEDFYRGDVMVGFGDRLECCFYDADHHRLQTHIIYKCHTVSKYESFPFVRKILGIGKHASGEKTGQEIVAYEKFDDTFENWVLKHKELKHDREWLIKGIRNILTAVYELESRDIPPGRINVVVWRDNLYLINVGVNVEGSTTKALVSHFLKTNFGASFQGNKDWPYFIDSFKDDNKLTIDQILKYPILLDPTETYLYFRVLMNYMSQESFDHVQEIMCRIGLNAKEFDEWNQKQPFLSELKSGSALATHFNRIYPKNDQVRTAWDLFKFIDKWFDNQTDKNSNVVSGVGTTSGAQPQVIHTRVQELAIISQFFPGFLSCFHDILAKNFGDIGITRKHYKPQKDEDLAAKNSKVYKLRPIRS